MTPLISIAIGSAHCKDIRVELRATPVKFSGGLLGAGSVVALVKQAYREVGSLCTCLLGQEYVSCTVLP